MAEKTNVVWREWYNDETVKKLTEFGTLPRYETEIDCRLEDGEGVACLIAEETSRHDPELFRETCPIVILEPPAFAGTYEVLVEYEPVFTAYRSSQSPQTRGEQR